MRILLLLFLFGSTLTPAVAHIDTTNVSELSATYYYSASNASPDQVYDWIKTTFRRLEPVYLSKTSTYAIPIYVGNRRNNVQATLTISVKEGGYTYVVSDVRMIGHGEQTDQLPGRITRNTDWYLLLVRHSFEEYLMAETLSSRK